MHEQEQPQCEEQVVDAQQDVLASQPEVPASPQGSVIMSSWLSCLSHSKAKPATISRPAASHEMGRQCSGSTPSALSMGGTLVSTTENR